MLTVTIFKDGTSLSCLSSVLYTLLFCSEEGIQAHVGMDREENSFYAAALLVTLLLGLWFIIKRIYVDRFVGNFHDKYVLLTGCDSGFGRETALRLDGLGFHVFATCLTSEGQADLTTMCSQRLRAIRLDVTDSHEIRETFKFVKQTLPENTGKEFIYL